MGILNKLFNSDKSAESKNKDSDLNSWIDLKEMKQLDLLVENSRSKTQFIFKHSTRCGVSRMVLNQLRKEYSIDENSADIYYLDLISYRDISNEIANRFEVRHESPQLLVLRNGTVVSHNSHGSINDMELEKFV